MKLVTKEDRLKYNSYMRVYHLKLYYTKRKEIIKALGGKCTKCGSKRRLEIDHNDPNEKELDVSKYILTLPKNKLAIELCKCQLLCKKCHGIKSVLERGQLLARGTHGTLSSYRYCHCSHCRQAKAIWQQNYRLKANATFA